MLIPIYQVDAFTSQLYSGNPAAVVLLSEPMSESTMQAVAAENNLSETAFLLAEQTGFRLRWFTPTMEIDLCGHATLASAHVLFSQHLVTGDRVEFYTLSGVLTVERHGEGYQMDFPLRQGQTCDLPVEISQRLPSEPSHVERYGEDYMVVLDEAGVVDFNADFFDLPGAGGVILTASSKSNFDIVSRYFGFCDLGINEDPVTGSIHCQLAHYWCQKMSTDQLSAYQASARGGQLSLRKLGDRVKLRGQAVTYLKGEILL